MKARKAEEEAAVVRVVVVEVAGDHPEALVAEEVRPDAAVDAVGPYLAVVAAPPAALEVVDLAAEDVVKYDESSPLYNAACTYPLLLRCMFSNHPPFPLPTAVSHYDRQTHWSVCLTLLLPPNRPVYSCVSLMLTT
jgi:hypothetical protein